MMWALAVAGLHMQSGVGWWCLDTAVGRAAAVSSVLNRRRASLQQAREALAPVQCLVMPGRIKLGAYTVQHRQAGSALLLK